MAEDAKDEEGQEWICHDNHSGKADGKGYVSMCKYALLTLKVAGGERKGKSGLEVLDDLEIFTGKRWVKSKQKMKKPRSRFSLVKVPKKDVEGKRRKNKN